ncbi:MAG: hypothetical protein M1816_001607 [Peltula sp. TS41687]|nr:MAG: hypothetical protein M1816_001607 [Peltula sp. TS41687]
MHIYVASDSIDLANTGPKNKDFQARRWQLSNLLSKASNLCKIVDVFGLGTLILFPPDVTQDNPCSRPVSTHGPFMPSLTMANVPHSYESGYELNIGCPLGLPPAQVHSWILLTGIPMRMSYPYRAPDRDVRQPRAEWIAQLLQLYLDRRAIAAQVNDLETNWARAIWNHGQNSTTIPDAITLPLHIVFRELKRRIDRYGRRQNPPQGIPRAGTQPVPTGTPTIVQGGQRGLQPPTSAHALSLPSFAASALSTFGPTDRH